MRGSLAQACGALAILAVTIFVSCGMRVERNPDALMTSFPADPPTLNPVLASDYNAYLVNKFIYESLLDRDIETLQLKPALAEEWESSPDHLVYTMKIRKGVAWHDGRPFSAEDVVWTFKKALDPDVDAAGLRSYLKDLKSVEQIGDERVRFVFIRPYFKALDIIGASVRIVPKHIFEKGDFNTNEAGRSPVGTGPFKFIEWKTGRHIKLARFDNYWGEKSALKGIIFRIIPNSTSSFMLLKKGALDMRALTAIQWQKQTTGKFDENFSRFRYYLPNSSFIAWNMRRPFFADRRVRIAMTMMINRQEILKKVMFGEGEVVTSDFYRFGQNYDTSIVPYPYDPDEAKRLLKEAGWIDQNFQFTLFLPAGDLFGKSIGLFLQDELMKAGVKMEMRQLEWAVMLKLISARDFDAVIMGGAGPINEDPYQVWHSSQSGSGSNIAGFSNEKVDRILDAARMEFDASKRSAMYKEMQQITHYEEPYSFLFTNPTLVAVAKRFENVKDYKLGLNPIEWKVGPWKMLYEW